MNLANKKSNLNFRVYTATEIPETGVENDIAIITNAKMKNWIMSPNLPLGIPRSDGDVWIQYSTDGDSINALKEDYLLIRIVSAYQYVDNSWKDVDFAIYKSGAFT